MIGLKFINESNNPDPKYATSGSSGFDLRAYLSEPLTIKSGEFLTIPTGLFFSIPENMEIQVRSRSGLAAKNGIAVLNGIGTIDSDYLGMVKVILINHGKEDFNVENGDRIAQAIVCSVISKKAITLMRVDTINVLTKRSSNGFGSTGIK